MIRIATRRSPLALWQAEWVFSLLQHHSLEAELFPVVTTGDKLQNGSLSNQQVQAMLPHHQTGKGLFIKEIQEALLQGHAELAVHSMKDLGTEVTPGILPVACLPRAGAHDVMILGDSLKELYAGSGLADRYAPQQILDNVILNHQRVLVVGTTSGRRKTILERRYGPKVHVQILRGNVDTRLARLKRNEFDAILLAEAGLVRLGLYDPERMVLLAKDVFVPAPAQGIVCIECPESSQELVTLLTKMSQENSVFDAILERLALWLLGGDCQMPVGVHHRNGTLSVAVEVQGNFLRFDHVIESACSMPLRRLLTDIGPNFAVLFSEAKRSLFARTLREVMVQHGFEKFVTLRSIS